MNLLCRGNGSINGYQSSILRKMEERGVFDKCVVITHDVDGKDRYLGQRYRFIDIGKGYYNSYCDCYDINELLPLSEKIIEDMHPYEAMAMKMTLRVTGFPVYTYDEAREEYLLHLRFWNHVLETEEIDVAYFSVVPHFIFEYVLYGLARSKGIPTIVSEAYHITGYHFLIGDSIENLGYQIKEYYNEMLSAGVKEVKLDKSFEDFYQRIRSGSIKILTQEEREANRKDATDAISLRYVYPEYVNYHKRPYEHRVAVDKYLNDEKKMRLDEIAYEGYIEKVKRARKYVKALMLPDEYESLTVTPDYNEAYIYFALQLTPEATTLPLAGVFENQLLSLEILSYAAKRKGIQVYVKEHYVQYGRTEEFYRRIEALPNVKLISTKVSSMDLINNCAAVATQTGTCILEGIIKDKPVLAFAKGYWTNAPGVCRVYDLKSCEEALAHIIDKDYIIEQSKVRIFLKAYEKATFLSTHDCFDMNLEDYEFNDYIESVVDKVVSEIEKISGRKGKDI